jgi:hypothetical protein
MALPDHGRSRAFGSEHPMQLASDSSLALNAEPLGDMTLAPFAMTKRTEADLARAMAEHLHGTRPGSGAEALTALRRAFPDSPLTLRVTALAALMRR